MLSNTIPSFDSQPPFCVAHRICARKPPQAVGQCRLLKRQLLLAGPKFYANTTEAENKLPFSISWRPALVSITIDKLMP